MIFRKSLKVKLILSYGIVVLFSLGCVAFFLDKNLEENSLWDIKTSLINQGYLIESQIAPGTLQSNDTVSLEALTQKLASRIGCRLTIVSKEGKVIADSAKSPQEVLGMENHAGRPEIRSALSGKTMEDIRYSSTLKIDMLYVALPLKDKGEIIGSLRLAVPLVSVERALSVTRNTVASAFLLALALAFALGLILAGGITRPINRIIQASRRFAQEDFSRKVFVDSQDEIGELGFAMNKMAQDIEDKIREIKTHNQHLSAIFNSMIEGVIVTDKSGRIISLNPAVEKIFGVLKQEAEGRFFLEAIRNNDISEVVNRVLKKGEFVSEELSLVWPVQRIFQVNASPVFEKETVSGCLVVIHDITEIRKLETIRRDFVANVSHELKTPLTSIKGFVETLLEGAMDDKENSRNFLRIVAEHANRLDNLVNDLLALSALESHHIELETAKLNLRELTDKVLAGFGSQLRKKTIEAKNDLPAGFLITADRNRIEQVMTNLIDNAVKFNREKGWVKIYAQEGADKKIKIVVEDSGQGIPEKDIPRIFERFYRVDKARSRELGGTGLGLSIVKHIVELHGGSVGVESAEGYGAKFWFILP